MNAVCTVIVALALSVHASAQDTLRIATWNLEHLGKREPARKPADLEAIAEFVRTLDAPVIAVQEIRTPEILADVCDRLGPSWDFVLGTTGMFSKTDGIRVGFVFDADRVDLVHAEELRHLPSTSPDGSLPIFHRKPVSAVFRSKRGGFDFRAITVHFKAGRGDKNTSKRVHEVEALGEYIETIASGAGEDQDIVVLGDFNHTYGTPPHQKFSGRGLTYLKAQGRPPTIVHFDDPIDHVAITRGMESDLSEPRLTVHGERAERDKAAWRSTFSDHIPVSFEVHDVDTDPDATFTITERAHVLARATELATEASAGRAPITALELGATVRVSYATPEGTATADGTLVRADAGWVEIRITHTTMRGLLEGSVVAFPYDRVISVERFARDVANVRQGAEGNR